MTIELGKDDQYQTRDGRQVRIHAIDLASVYPVLFSVRADDGWHSRLCYANGSVAACESKNDIVEKPTIRECWVNVYPGSHSSLVHNSRASANAYADKTQMAVMRIRYRDCDIKDGVIELRSWEDK